MDDGNGSNKEIIRFFLTIDSSRDLIASQYGWSLKDIDDLTYRQMKKIIKAIETRTEQEEYMKRLHVALQATTTIKVLAAALKGEECTVESLIGPEPWAKPVENSQANEFQVGEWKQAAKHKGLKIGNTS